jgi:hypothetical protein
MVREMRHVLAACLVLAPVLAGCPREVPPPNLAAADAGPTPAQLAAADVERLEAEVASVVYAVDAALWAHWTAGAPLDLAAVTARHDALFRRETLDTLRRARELVPADARRIAHLERWVAGELLARGVAAEAEAVANLEASLTFSYDGREVPWRDLGRLLANEKSAIRRRALWAASHPAALRLDAALARREAKEREVLASLELPSPLDFAAELREFDLDALAKQAEALLADTDAEWAEALATLSDGTVKLTATVLTRADLPRLLRPAPEVDAAFPRTQASARVTQTLGGLGLADTQSLVVELSDAPQRRPLPLTVTPSAEEVRVSARPAAGLRETQALLAEVGAAVALHAARAGPFATARLGDPAVARHAAELFSMLPAEPDWLEAAGIAPAQRTTIEATARAQHLFALRRAAAVVLARLETHALEDEAAARARFVAITARALGISPAAQDGSRWRLETDDFLRAATALKAARAAAAMRSRLGDGWWRSPERARPLLERLARGTAEPLE